MPNFEYKANLSEFEDSPEIIQKLLGIWHRIKANNSFPLKSELNPADFKGFLGRLCILDIIQDPLDFIYRLDGTEISAASNEDLVGQSILAGTPKEIYAIHYDEFKASYEASKPILWRISYIVSEGNYDYFRVILPFSRDEKSTGEIPNLFMTYCHSLKSIDGSFDSYRKFSSGS